MGRPIPDPARTKFLSGIRTGNGVVKISLLDGALSGPAFQAGYAQQNAAAMMFAGHGAEYGGVWTHFSGSFTNSENATGGAVGSALTQSFGAGDLSSMPQAHTFVDMMHHVA